jgi:lipopolysaccharide/colanic/teichoic acid biosynthesis glycosyltransferase
MRAFFDTTLAVLALIILSPLLVIIALAIFIDSPGNPFYRASRIGQGGHRFGMWKFRTMIKNAAALGPPITGNMDPRVLRIGHFLRRTKLDELPQFLNVVMGDMSLVGPRPEAPEIVAHYTSEQLRILSVKPGMTGKVQLDTGDESLKFPVGAQAGDYYVQHMMEGKLLSDLNYLSTRSFFSDLRILFATAAFVLRSFVRK